MAITVVAELADRAGVFEAAARRLALISRGHTFWLFALVAALGAVLSIVMSLDTTAVLLTPIVIALALRLNLNPLPFALLSVYLANTASLLLPVSNLTNLLAVSRLGGTSFVGLMWAPALAAFVVPTVALWCGYGRRLPRRYPDPGPSAPRDRTSFAIATAVCVALGPLFVSGLEPAYVSVGAALVLAVTAYVRDREAFAHIAVPWKMALAMAALFTVVELLHVNGLGAALERATGASGTSWLDLTRLTLVAAASSNLLNNLPAYLALEPTAGGDPLRLAALLIGTNVGPLVLMWGSLANVLWRERCAGRGVKVSSWRFARLGLFIVPLTLLASVTALWATHR
ncbi:arsenic transporter [Micrococcales bacterium 31B]|nr:arsenic transporter [Micrococcales bacterium 31B]